MKKLFLLFLLILFLCCVSCKKVDNSPTLLAPNGDYEFLITNDCTIRSFGINKNYFFYNNKQLFEGNFYSYALSKDKNYLFFHNFLLNDLNKQYPQNSIIINAQEYNIKTEEFVIFDITREELHKFPSLMKCNEYISKKAIRFDAIYCQGVKSKKEVYNEKTFILDNGGYYAQKLFYDNFPVFEGYIKNIKQYDDTYISFDLTLANSYYPQEYIHLSNKSLNLKKYHKEGKIHAEGLIFFDKQYESNILFNIKTGEFVERK